MARVLVRGVILVTLVSCLLVVRASARPSETSEEGRPACPEGQEYKYALKHFDRVEDLSGPLADGAHAVNAAVPNAPPDKKKCRRIRFYASSAPNESAPIVRLRETLSDQTCRGEPVEWDFSVKHRSSLPVRPAKGHGGKAAKYELDLSYDPTDKDFRPKWSFTSEVKGEGSAPKDLVRNSPLVPASARPLTQPCGAVLAERWKVASVTLGGETIEVEAERWTWAGDSPETRDRAGKPVAAEVSFKVHDPTIAPEVAAFASALADAFGSRIDTTASKTEKVLQCSPVEGLK